MNGNRPQTGGRLLVEQRRWIARFVGVLTKAAAPKPTA